MLSPLRVLFVQFSAKSRAPLLDALEAAGCACNPMQASSKNLVKVLEKERPDIAIICAGKTGAGPEELIRTIKSAREDLPVLVYAENASEGAVVDSLRAGAADFITSEGLERLAPAFSAALGTTRPATASGETSDRANRRETLLNEAEALAKLGSFEWIVPTDEYSWSDELYRIFGWPIGSPVSIERIGSSMTPEDFARWKETVEALSPDNAVIDFCHRITRADGEQRWIQVRAKGEFSDGSLQRMLGTAQDITEPRRADEAMRESDAIVTSILESALDAILMVNRDGVITAANQAAGNIFGYPHSEFPGKNVEDLLGEIGHRKFRDGSFVRFLRSSSGDKLLRHRFEVEGRRASGETFPAELTITRIDADGSPVFTGFVRDISDRKNLEETLRIRTEQMLRHQKALLELAALDKSKFAPTLEQIVRTAAQTLEVERVSFWAFQEDVLQCELLYRRSRDVWEFGHILNRSDYPDYFGAITSSPVVASDDAANDPRTREFAESYLQPLGIAAMLDVSVWNSGKLVGVVCHEHVGSPRNWTPEEQKFAASIGHMLSLAIAEHERQQAERALRVSEERFRVTFEDAPVGIGHKDTSGRWLWVNQRLCEIVGRSREELLQMTCIDLTHPDDREISTQVMSRLRSGETRSHSFDKRYIQSDGTAIWVNVSNSVKVDERGQPEYLIAVVAEITDRKRAEERVIEQANLLDLTHDAIIVRDLDDRILFWNKGAEKLYGVGELVAIGQRESGMLYADTWDFDTAKRAVLEKGEWHGELRQHAPGNKAVVVDARWTLVQDEHGVAKSILAINTDITGRKALEEQFLRAQRLESIGTLASGVAHDLNNILAPILMAVPMLRGELPEDIRESLVSTIETSAQRGADIVRQVLTFARGVEGERVLLQPYHLLREMEKIAAETFPKTVVVRNRAPRELWPVNGDATQLHQVLMNLCVNARDAMADGGILTLEAENFHMDESYASMMADARVGDYVILKVSDTGSGISREVIAKIFDPFFTTKEPGKGTGLGLSTVMGIVRSHGGFLKVESEPGRGTAFQVYLPASTEGLEERQQAEAPTKLPRGKGELVLVVDDEAGVREVTSAVLKKNNYEVLVAADGTEALAAFAQSDREVNVVLTDVVMPHIDGVALTRALRKLSPKVRIVAATGHTQNHRAAELRSLDVQGFLHKPFTAETLLQVVHDALKS